MSDNILKRSPDDFDWPATIFLYAMLVLMGVGMCFCLKRANRLIPNRFNFPLVDRGERRERGFHDLGAEEEGLLSHYSDVEDEDDAQAIGNQNALGIIVSRNSEQDFGHLQSHDDMDDNDQVYENPFTDDHTNK